MKRRIVVVVSSLFLVLVGTIGFLAALGAGDPTERQVRDGLRTTGYFGGGGVLRTSAGEWTLEFNDSGTAITFFEPIIAFESGRISIDTPFDGRIYMESLGRVVMLGLRSDKRLIYEALLRLEEDDARELIQILDGRPATPGQQRLYEALLTVEGDDALELIQTFRGSSGLTGTAVPRQVDVIGQATAPGGGETLEIKCPGGSCNCGQGNCSACCPEGKSPNCDCGTFSDNCSCGPEAN